MGFCFFNSVAIAAKQLRLKHKMERILIVDWVNISSCHIFWGKGGSFLYRREEMKIRKIKEREGKTRQKNLLLCHGNQHRCSSWRIEPPVCVTSLAFHRDCCCQRRMSTTATAPSRSFTKIPTSCTFPSIATTTATFSLAPATLSR